MSRRCFTAGIPAIRRQSLPLIRVGRVAGRPARGKLLAGPLVLPCALGPAGLVRAKREGDGGTPIGRFGLQGVWARRDRLAGFRAGGLPLRRTAPADRWCDDPASRHYNRPVRLPFAASCETMWRADGLYDLVVVIDYNVSHPRPGRGSAIFMHVAREGFAPTAGCVALRRGDLLRLVPRLSPRTKLVIG